MPEVAAVLMFVGVVAYAIFGGADFGAGVWDLLAGDAERGGGRRARIDASIGPVWEANHVWLIYVLVFMWSAFPTAFAAVMTTLYVPWLLAALGIVLRGATFAFRKFAPTIAHARAYGAVFAASSVITPFFLGAIAGGIASGRVPLEGGDVWTSWTGPTSIVGGTLAVLTCAFVAAVFLAADSSRAGETANVEWFARRALVSGLLTGAVALAGIVPLAIDAPTLARHLQGRAAPLVIGSGLLGVATLRLLWQRRYAIARFTAVGAVAAVVVGWGVGQYPDVLVDQLTIADGAGADATLVGLVIVFGVAAVTAVPALIWLYVLVTSERTAR
jgi:cytochrome bd ubiquinol oxidase subunit II